MINNTKDYNKSVSKPSFVSQKIFSENFVAIHEIKQVMTSNKPIYGGFSIPDLNRLLMSEFHYNYIKAKYNNYAKLLFKDRDSLIYEIEADDIYEDSYEDKDLFDFSDYSKDSKFFDPFNKKVVGKIKDELKGKIISEFVGLKSKMCSLIEVDK